MTAILTVRLSDEDYSVLKDKAKEKRISTSGYARMILVEYLRLNH
jgi:predicted DNA binding CopG/RHH family protein